MRPSFFFALLALPVVAATIYLSAELTFLHDLEERFVKAARKEKGATERRGKKERFLARHTDPDPYFIDRRIESFPLLEKELIKLNTLLNHPAFPECRSIKDRFEFLKENRLSFTEENIQSSGKIKEVEEKLRRPVQMDETDLQKILTLIEDLPSEPSDRETPVPQLVIKEFRLKKIETQLETELFEVQMDLIKREFTKS